MAVGTVVPPKVVPKRHAPIRFTQLSGCGGLSQFGENLRVVNILMFKCRRIWFNLMYRLSEIRQNAHM